MEQKLNDLNNLLNSTDVKKDNIEEYKRKKHISGESKSLLNIVLKSFDKIFPNLNKEEKDVLIKNIEQTIDYHNSNIDKYSSLTKISNMISSIRNGNFNNQYSCSICCSNDNQFVNIDCGHVVCKECCKKNENCPICKRKINQKTNIYL